MINRLMKFKSERRKIKWGSIYRSRVAGYIILSKFSLRDRSKMEGNDCGAKYPSTFGNVCNI